MAGVGFINRFTLPPSTQKLCMPDAAAELIALNHRLLDAITSGDWKTYAELCDETLTCFEPECLGHLIHGLEFHKFYFDLPPGPDGPTNTTMCDPHVRFLGPDSAIVCYIRLTQKVGAQGPVSMQVNETRIWQKNNGQWRHVHFHRSPV